MSSNKNQNITDNRVDRELQIFEAINHKIEHEDNLFVSRITWFISLQALLFFPVFLIFSQTAENSRTLTGLSRTFFRHQENLLLGIILTGLSFCFVVLLGCQASHFRVIQLTELYRQKRERFRQDYSSYLHLVLNVRSSPWIRLSCSAASFGSVFIFSKIWLFLEVIINVHQNAVILSLAIVILIDSIIIYNFLDCVFDFLRFDKHRKFLNQILLSIISTVIELFVTLYIIFENNTFW